MDAVAEKARQIIADLARRGRVEQFVRAAAHTDTLGADLLDLCQETYCIVLDYRPEQIVDLWDHGDMDFFLARIIVNQLRSKTSRYHYKYRHFRAMCQSLDGLDLPDDGESIPSFVTK